MCMAWEKIHSSPGWPQLAASVLGVGAVCWLGVVGQHVVVHVDGGAVVDGVTQTLCEDGLARVRGQAKQEEAGLCSRKAIDRLKEMIRGAFFIVCTVNMFVFVNRLGNSLVMTSPYQPWWFGTSAWYQLGWKATWTGQTQNVGTALAPHWWTPPSSAKTNQ